MKISNSIYLFLVLLILCIPIVRGETPVEYSASLSAGGGSGEFSPYYISSLQGGRFSQQYNLQAEVAAEKKIDLRDRFSYGVGLDVIGGASSSVKYDRYDMSSSSMTSHSLKPSTFWLQQLYGELKWRSIFLNAGLKERGSALLNNSLTSGDLIESGNARPIPQVRAGFLDFQNIPFTSGWVQIQGEAAYGMLLDDGWWEDHYNYYNYHITKKALYNYKRVYFRTKPSEKFSVIIGMQAAAKFGGTAYYYEKGELKRTEKNKCDFKTFAKMLIPIEDGGETFYTGSHLGSWEMRARYTIGNGDQVFGYFSFPWEDGSGIGKLNGWDGLWGIEYRSSNHRSIITSALIEYLDFTNQSGPLHFNPADYAGTTIPDHVSGSDDYYNNLGHNPYAYYGMSIGTPALMAPIYNTNGYMGYCANVMRGIHFGLEGAITSRINYRVKGGYRKAWGSGYFLLPEPIHLTAVMIEATWRPSSIEGLSVNGKIEIDRGDEPCNATGAMITVKYAGLLNFGK